MTLALLRLIMPPPSEPVECGTWEEWTKTTALMGTRLPLDYMNYILAYGSGQIANFIWPFNPLSANKHLNLMEQVMPNLSALRVLKEEFGSEAVPYPLYYEPGGLLPWGRTDNGDVMYWLTTGGNPDNWSIVVGEARGPDWEHYHESMTGFLEKLLTGQIVSAIFPNDFIAAAIDGSPLFVPLNKLEGAHSE
jgi:hypothetical protein